MGDMHPEKRSKTVCPACGMKAVLVWTDVAETAYCNSCGQVLWQREPRDRGELRPTYAQLKAIVDRLPQTADGVPIVPGDTVWILKFEKHLFEAIDFRWRSETFPGGQVFVRGYWGNAGYDSDVKWSEVFSTREAAEAAVKGGD